MNNECLLRSAYRVKFMLNEAQDFLQESDVFNDLLVNIESHDWDRKTQFKDWSVNDVVVHLHFWNKAADLSLTDSDSFAALYEQIKQGIATSSMRSFENNMIKEHGLELLTVWRDYYRDMVTRWLSLDPKTRVKWAGPDMSVRSAISARQMETWAHSQTVFDIFGQDRPESDRIRNIVFLGVNTFQWSFKNRGMEAPAQMPYLRLTSPSGEIWTFGEADSGSMIEGSAVEFCQVTAQTRSYADTTLNISGGAATLWMQNAQNFAGAPQPPPASGSRFKATI